MAAYGSPLVPRRRLAAELGRLRKGSGLTGGEVARRLGWSASKVSRYELARTGLKPDDVASLLDVYQVAEPARNELLSLAAASEKRGWWDAYSDVLPEELAELIGLEADAKSALTWQIECVPGLLQTAEYARQVNRSYAQLFAVPPGVMERRVQARLLRQQVLTRERALELSVIIDESALLRRVADAMAMREQMAHILKVSRQPNVTIQVLRLAGRDAVIWPSFVVMEFDTDTLPDVAYVEHLVSNIYFDGETDTYQYKLVYQQLASAALSPAESLKFVSALAERL